MNTLRWIDRLAHDLRGPLAPLQTAAYLLRSDQVDDARRQELLAVIDRQARQLGSMIDELSDWTRMAQDRLLGSHERCDPALLLDYARTQSGVAEAAIRLHAGDITIMGDPMRLTQLLRILIEHAAHEGSPPTIDMEAAGDRLRIDVRAEGPAPDEARLALLFEEPQPDPPDDGLGLRLLIAHAIALAHGGSLVAMMDQGRMLLRCELPMASA